jgi:hypothetical protein
MISASCSLRRRNSVSSGHRTSFALPDIEPGVEVDLFDVVEVIFERDSVVLFDDVLILRSTMSILGALLALRVEYVGC